MPSLTRNVDLSTIPLAPNPSGAGPNFINPPTLAPVVTGVGIAMIILSVFFVTLRLYSNFFAIRRLGWDDYFCVTALVLTISFTSVLISDHDIQRHNWDIPKSVVLNESIIKKNFVLGMLVGPCIFFAKASILLLYIRLFGLIRWIRYLVWIGMISLFFVTWITVPLFLVYCTPRPGARWEPAIFSRCQKVAVLGILQGTFHVLFDVFIIALPVPVIWNLNLEFRKKLGLLAVFMTGSIGIVTSGLTLYYRLLTWKHEDPAWNATKSYMCIFVETYVAIIVSCTPAFFSFWRNHLATTTIFSTLWSRLVSSRSTGSATKGSEKGHPGAKCPPSSPPRRPPQNDYLELQEPDLQHMNRTVIQSFREYLLTPEPGTIINSIAIDQSSQMREKYAERNYSILTVSNAEANLEHD